MLECYEFEECEYNGNPTCYLPDGMSCPHGVTAHKLTNADRIRAMSDEELSEFISRIEIGDFGPQVYGKTFCDMCKSQNECDDCRLWWLQQLAEEDT